MFFISYSYEYADANLKFQTNIITELRESDVDPIFVLVISRKLKPPNQ